MASPSFCLPALFRRRALRNQQTAKVSDVPTKLEKLAVNKLSGGGGGGGGGGNFLLFMELRKKVLSFRDIFDIPPFNGSVPIHELIIATAEDLHRMYPELIPNNPTTNMKEKNTHQGLICFYGVLNNIGDSWTHDKKTKEKFKKVNIETFRLEELVKLVVAMLDCINKAAKERFDLIDEDETKHNYNDSSRSISISRTSMDIHNMDCKSPLCFSPQTPTSVLPESPRFDDYGSSYSPPRLWNLRAQAVEKLSPMDWKRITLHMFPHLQALENNHQTLKATSAEESKLENEQINSQVKVDSLREIQDHNDKVRDVKIKEVLDLGSTIMENEEVAKCSESLSKLESVDAKKDQLSPLSSSCHPSPPPPPPSSSQSQGLSSITPDMASIKPIKTMHSPSDDAQSSSPIPPNATVALPMNSAPLFPPPSLSNPPRASLAPSPPPPPPPPPHGVTHSPQSPPPHSVSPPPPLPPLHGTPPQPPSIPQTVGPPPPPAIAGVEPPPPPPYPSVAPPPPAPPCPDVAPPSPAPPCPSVARPPSESSCLKVEPPLPSRPCLGVAPPPPPPCGTGVPMPPTPISKGGGPPPPPPGVGKSLLRPKLTKLKRSSHMGNLYRLLKRKVEGACVTGESSQGKKSVGSNPGGGGGRSMADALAEMTKRSSYFQQIEDDVQKHEKEIKDMQASLNNFQTKDMNELMKFHKDVESRLEVLTDESQVLSRFEGFPMKKLEALRMATSLYSKLNGILTELQNFKIESPLGQLLDKVEKYFNKIKGEMESLDRTKDEESKKFQSHKIHFDFNILTKIKESIVDVSSSCMELALKERREAKANTNDQSGSKAVGNHKVCANMLWRAFQFAFKVYSFAGGQDERADRLTRELAQEIETYSTQE